MHSKNRKINLEQKNIEFTTTIKFVLHSIGKRYKLNPNEEKALAEEGILEAFAKWPTY